MTPDHTLLGATGAPPVAPSPGAGGDLAARVAALEERAASPAAEKARPWYRQASVLIAAVALAFSMGATFFGEQRAGERDEAAARGELSQLIQRLTSLPREVFELQATYAGQPTTLNTLSGMVTTEDAVLAQQASDVIARIPESVSGSEYVAVGQALMLAGDYARAERVLDAGLARDNDASASSALWRTKAGLDFATGEVAPARAAMAHALDAYATEPPAVSAAADAYTELLWAGNEKTLGACDLATDHLERADALIDSLPLSPYRAQMLQSASALRATGTSACPVS